MATVTKSAPKQNVAPTQEKQSPKKTFAPPPEGMVQCGICGRNFLEDRIAKHETICSKNAAKKRKVFDSTKHRVQVICILISLRLDKIKSELFFYLSFRVQKLKCMLKKHLKQKQRLLKNLWQKKLIGVKNTRISLMLLEQVRF